MKTTHLPQIEGDLTASSNRDLNWIHDITCHECRVCGMENRVMPNVLEQFVVDVLKHYHVPETEARTTAHILVAADVRGIPSHGVARLSRYIQGIQKGFIVPGVSMEVHEPTTNTATINAHNGLGQVAGEQGILLAIEKAKNHGIGVVTIKHSNHYGIAGYYALKAVENDLIGISLTNSAPLVVPTHGSSMILGTNPIAFGAPTTEKYPPFLLDMATSVVPRGKLEVYDRNCHQMPLGWAVDEHGYDCQNPTTVLHNLIHRIGGGILPLGGRGESFSGHKGYGLSFMVDILCGVLSGAAYGPNVDNLSQPKANNEPPTPDVGHFFLVMNIEMFMPITEFKQRLEEYITLIKNSKVALDQDQIYFHGEKSYARTKVHYQSGIPISDNVYSNLVSIAQDVSIGPPARVATR